jgi:hypothetical protein
VNRPEATFTLIAPGRQVLLRGDWKRSMGFTRGRISRVISSLDRVIENGGYYRIKRLDGPEDMKDLEHDLHRLCFTPVSNTILARLGRALARKRAKENADARPN